MRQDAASQCASLEARIADLESALASTSAALDSAQSGADLMRGALAAERDAAVAEARAAVAARDDALARLEAAANERDAALEASLDAQIALATAQEAAAAASVAAAVAPPAAASAAAAAAVAAVQREDVESLHSRDVAALLEQLAHAEARAEELTDQARSTMEGLGDYRFHATPTRCLLPQLRSAEGLRVQNAELTERVQSLQVRICSPWSVGCPVQATRPRCPLPAQATVEEFEALDEEIKAHHAQYEASLQADAEVGRWEGREGDFSRVATLARRPWPPPSIRSARKRGRQRPLHRLPLLPRRCGHGTRRRRVAWLQRWSDSSSRPPPGTPWHGPSC